MLARGQRKGPKTHKSLLKAPKPLTDLETRGGAQETSQLSFRKRIRWVGGVAWGALQWGGVSSSPAPCPGRSGSGGLPKKEGRTHVRTPRSFGAAFLAFQTSSKAFLSKGLQRVLDASHTSLPSVPSARSALFPPGALSQPQAQLKGMKAVSQVRSAHDRPLHSREFLLKSQSRMGT